MDEKIYKEIVCDENLVLLKRPDLIDRQGFKLMPGLRSWYGSQDYHGGHDEMGLQNRRSALHR